MTQSAFQFLTSFLAQIFRLFTSWYFPGTNVTPAGLMFFFAFAFLAVRFIVAVFLNATDAGESAHRYSSRRGQ